METVWTSQQHQQAGFLGIGLDPDECSEPGSVPMPNEDFEPFFTDYAQYDEHLQSTLDKVHDLGISGHDNYSVYDPATDGEFVITRPGQHPSSYDYYDAEENSWASPHKSAFAPIEALNSSPVKASHQPRLDPMPYSSPVKTPMHAGHSPEFFTPSTPAQPNKLLFSPSHAPPIADLSSSPPSSPSRRLPVRHFDGYMGVDSLGIQMKEESESTNSSSQIKREPLDYQSPPNEDALNWQPILTIPAEVHRESDRIIRSQRSTTELKTKRKSCLPPGTVDEFIGDHHNGTYKCLYPHCERLFRRKYNLKSHIQTHLCDRPYVCESCEATFVRPHDLKRHQLCHQSTRSFVCPCGKGFTRMDAMQRHRARMICDGGLPGGSPSKSVRKRRSRVVAPSPSDSGSSPSDGYCSTPTL